MAEDKENKTEPATPRRRQEARDSGQIAKSADLTAAALLLAGLWVLGQTATTMVSSLKNVLAHMLGSGEWGESANPVNVLENAVRFSWPHVLQSLAPILLAVMGVAFLTTGMQVGFHLNFKPLMPNLGKLNPLQGMGRLFGGRNFMQVGMNMMKVVLIALITWNELSSQFTTIMNLSNMAFPANFMAAAGIIYDLTWRIAFALLLLAFADWLYQKWKFERDIRMSKQEIKDEAKRMEGDPSMKGKRRQLARKMIMQRIHSDVPKADVVITNPTELAIALRYDPENMGAPRVVAKGAGFLAARIRQIAVSNGVPIVERKPLAQALYKTVEVGQDVPPEFYQAIAEILAYVYELSGKVGGMVSRAGEARERERVKQAV